MDFSWCLEVGSARLWCLAFLVHFGDGLEALVGQHLCAKKPFPYFSNNFQCVAPSFTDKIGYSLEGYVKLTT